MLIIGQLQIGSSLYVVLYASCTLWTALLSRLMLESSSTVGHATSVEDIAAVQSSHRPPLTLVQWVALFAITLSLAGDAMLSLFGGDDAGEDGEKKNDMEIANSGSDREAGSEATTTTNINIVGILVVCTFISIYS
jgi:hypothetical protein